MAGPDVCTPATCCCLTPATMGFCQIFGLREVAATWADLRVLPRGRVGNVRAVLLQHRWMLVPIARTLRRYGRRTAPAGGALRLDVHRRRPDDQEEGQPVNAKTKLLIVGMALAILCL